MSLFSARMKNVQSKTKALECWQHFLHYKSMGMVYRHSMAANSAVNGRIWPNFLLIRDLIIVLVTRNNEEYTIKNKGVRVLTTLNIDFSDTQGQLTQQSADGFSRISKAF